MIEIYYSHGIVTIDGKIVTTVKNNKQTITIIKK